MNNKDYRLENLERQLQINEAMGKKVFECNLTPEQSSYLESVGYNLEILLYSFKTRQFKDIRSKPNLIKEIHYACKRKKWMMKRRLTREEMEVLRIYNIKFTPIKFRIYLRRTVQ